MKDFAVAEDSDCQDAAEEELGTDLLRTLSASSRLLGDGVQELLRLSSLLVLHPESLRSGRRKHG